MKKNCVLILMESDKKFHKKEQVRALHIMVETEDEIRDIQKELQRKQKVFLGTGKGISLWALKGAQGR